MTNRSTTTREARKRFFAAQQRRDRPMRAGVAGAPVALPAFAKGQRVKMRLMGVIGLYDGDVCDDVARVIFDGTPRIVGKQHLEAVPEPCAPQAAPAPATPAPRFRVGDRVRCTGDSGQRAVDPCFFGKEGTIVERGSASGTWRVDFGARKQWVDPCDLKPLAPAKPEACRMCGAHEGHAERCDAFRRADPTPAKLEAVLPTIRYACGTEAMVGDVVLAYGAEQTVRALHTDGFGNHKPGAVCFEASPDWRPTMRYWLVDPAGWDQGRFLRRAPAAAGADGHGRAREVG